MVRGEIQGVIDDKLVLNYFINKNDSTKNITFKEAEFAPEGPEQLTEEDGIVLAMAKDNTELLHKVNTGLDQIRADGTYDKIVKKWFGNVTNIYPIGVKHAAASTTK